MKKTTNEDTRLSMSQKLAILSADNFKCYFCGKVGDEASLIVQRKDAHLSANDPNNLITVCSACSGTLDKK